MFGNVLVLLMALAALAIPTPVSAFSIAPIASNPSRSIGVASFATRMAAGAAPTILEPPVKEKVAEKEERVEDASKYKKGGWAVRLFNDPMNKREFVAMCLSKIVGLSDGQAYQVMMQAHKNGVSVVGRFDLERAELYRDALCDNGLTCDMIPVEDD
jgi:ATP-dependent Clp protease adapter protein ClpS